MRANGRDITFTDGKKLFLGSSGNGAPDDAARSDKSIMHRSTNDQRDIEPCSRPLQLLDRTRRLR